MSTLKKKNYSGKMEKKKKNKISLGTYWLIAYPDFCCMKQLGVFLLPLDRMLAVRAVVKTELSYQNDTIIGIFFSPNKNKDNAN